MTKRPTPSPRAGTGKRLTRKAFDAWLAEQPAGPRFVPRDGGACPLGAYLGQEVNFTDPSAEHVKTVSGPYRRMPKWAASFVRDVDQYTWRISAKTALRILRSIP